MNLKHNLKAVMAAIAALSFTASAFADEKAEASADAKAPAIKADNDKCPVSGKAIDPEHVVAYAKAVGFCCEKCAAKFNKDAAPFLGAVAEAKAGAINTKCPVSGKAIDAEATAVYQGKTVGLCCEKCLAKFKKDPAALIDKVKADNPGNEKCPVSGKAVDAEQVVVFTTNVGLCCGKCEAKFKKDPEAIISKMQKKAE